MNVTCPVCGTVHGPGVRCPECNLDPGFGPARPNPFRSATLWALAGGLAVVYAVTLAVVALTN